MTGEAWAAELEAICDQVHRAVRRARPDGRLCPTPPVRWPLVVVGADRHPPHQRTVLAEETRIIAWAIDAQTPDPRRPPPSSASQLDVLQADVAAAVAGHDRLVLAVGPAGAGKTTTLAAAVADLHRQGRVVFGVAPSAKAARTLERETGMRADTLAKLLYEWERPDRPPADHYRLPAGATVIVDEAGMIGTGALDRLIRLTDNNGWRLALVGDPYQLQAVGRGGMFHELCASGRTHHLAHIHRFHQPWEAAASLQLRHGDPAAVDTYIRHGRVHPGEFDEHLDHIARLWLDATNTARRSPSLPRPTNTSTRSTTPSRPPAPPPVSSTPPCPPRSDTDNTPTPATSSSPAATTARSTPPPANPSATANCGPSPPSTTAPSTSPPDTAPATPSCPPTTSPNTSSSATPPPNTATNPTPSTSASNSSPPPPADRGLYVGATRGPTPTNSSSSPTTTTPTPPATSSTPSWPTTAPTPPPPPNTDTSPKQIVDRTGQHRAAEIPASFHQLQRQVQHDLAAARVAATAGRQRITDLEHDLTDAQHQLAAAERNLAQHRPALDAADRDVATARDRQLDAYSELRQSGRLGARRARRNVATANHAHESAIARRRDAQAVAQPAQDAANHARASLERIETTLSRTHTLNQWNGHSGRAEQLEQVAEALDHWQQWATGEAITPDTISKAVAVLRRHGLVRTETKQVGASVDRPVVGRRAQHRPAPPAMASRQPDVGIEL